MKEFKELSSLDLNLRLLSGESISVGNLEIIPYKLKEIINYGYVDYVSNVQWLCLSVEDFIKSVIDLEKRAILQSEKSKLKAFDFYFKLAGQEMREGLLTSLAMIFRTDDIRIIDDGIIAIDFMKMGIFKSDENGELIFDNNKFNSFEVDDLKLVHRDNFDEIVKVIKLQNYLDRPSKIEHDDANPADEETRQLIERMRKMKEKVEKKKKRQQEYDDDDVDISDIISAVTVKSYSINKFNVWDLTLCQLYDEYARLEVVDNYSFGIKAMLAGAEKIDLTHWASKI